MNSGLPKALFGWLAFALVLRLMLFVMAGPEARGFIEPDSPGYIQPALSLIEKGRFDQGPESSVPETFRPPVYPLWVAIVFSIAGHHAGYVVFSQFFIFMGTLYLVYQIGMRLFCARIGVWAVALAALNPNAFVFDFKVLSESLNVFLLLVFVRCVLRFVETKGRWQEACLLGLSFSVWTLERVASYYLLFPILLWAGGFLFKQFRFGRKMLHGLIAVLLPVLILLGGWQLRNLKVAGTFSISTGQNYVVWSSKAAQILAVSEGISLEAATQKYFEYVEHRHPEIDSFSKSDKESLYREEGLAVILSHPVLAVRTQLEQLTLLLLSPGSTSALFRIVDPDYQVPFLNMYNFQEYVIVILKEHPEFLLAVGLGLSYMAVLYMGIVSHVLHRKKHSEETALGWSHAATLLTVAYLALVASVVVGQARYRVMIDPVLCVYAASGWISLKKRFVDKKVADA